MKLSDFSKLYFTVLFLHLAVLYKQDTGALYYVSKPLILFSLLVYFVSLTNEIKAIRKWVIAALVFSLTGDILLIWEADLFFLGGIGAFALAQLSYSIFFIKNSSSFKILPLLIVLPMAITGLYILIMIINVPPQLVLPVNIYSLILITNLWAGINFQMSNNHQFHLISLGLILFFISDLLLAYNLYNNQELWQEIAVMLSYGFAQYLIVRGILKAYKPD